MSNTYMDYLIVQVRLRLVSTCTGLNTIPSHDGIPSRIRVRILLASRTDSLHKVELADPVVVVDTTTERAASVVRCQDKAVLLDSFEIALMKSYLKAFLQQFFKMSGLYSAVIH
eukprot:TRINITY_DN269_c0_g1_i1.p4 TRINITY_DN269_c0_g1~~TRINITY_DN269_c0_g1_i1.p4  ORF type:complete len:114 (+),score=3.71 TRINITY_DN269_c0_g1_i1:1257-1598(+)